MKNQFKYSILITLTILITTSLMLGQIRAIGGETQRSPFESNPTATSYFMVGAPLSTGRDAMKDGDLGSSGDFFLGAPHILRPNGDGARQTWTIYPTGLLHYFGWKEESSDVDATYLYTNTLNNKETSTLEDPPADASGTITSVTVYAVVRRTGGTATPSIKLMLSLGGVEAIQATGQTITTTSYAVKFFSWTTNPSGGAWTWANIADLQAGVQLSAIATSGQYVRVTQLYVEVAGPTTGYLELNTFTASDPATAFSVGFVDLKMKYKVDTALLDDTYKIEYTTGTTWVTLQAGTSDIFDRDAGEAVRPWSQVSEPTDGTWDWTDVANLKFRVTATQNGGSWDNMKMYIFEVWASVYPQWDIPPTGSAHYAVIPSGIYKVNEAEMMFADIYVTGVTEMRGFYLLLTFDNTVLTTNSYFIYNPFEYVTPGNELNDTEGWVILQQAGKSDTPPLTGSAPIARIYFTINKMGASELNIIDSTEFLERTWPTGVSESKLKDIYATNIPYVPHDGWVSTVRLYMSFETGILPPGNPTLEPHVWHEEYPNYGEQWHLTSWEDNGDGILSESDQIDMINSTDWIHWFHVDVVTITIHFTFKPDGSNPTGEKAVAESTIPITEMPTGTPVATQWHQIYGPPLGGGSSGPAGFCRTFTITSWTDNSPGGTFNPSDQFDFTYADDTGDPPVTYWAHLDTVTTDIILSMKPIPPEHAGVPEFPFGITILMALAPAIAIVYLWRTRPKKTKTGQ
jgi:hypothetical protein